MARKFKKGTKVYFVKSKVPTSEDEGVMDKYEGCECVIVDYCDEENYDYVVDILGTNATYSVKHTEIVKITPTTRLLYGI